MNELFVVIAVGSLSLFDFDFYTFDRLEEI